MLRSAWMLMLSILFFVTASKTTAQDQSAWFVSIEVTGNASRQLVLYNPSTGERVVKIPPESITLETTPFAGSHLSPAGSWIASFSSASAVQGQGIQIHLWNFSTGEVRILDSERWNYLLEERPNLAWSPDGRMIAFTIGTQSDARERTEIYLYSLDTDAWVNLSDDPLEQRDLAWSSDSRQLTSFAINCMRSESDSDNCSAALEIFDIHAGTGALESVVMLRDLEAPGLYACDAQASPDQQFIAFVSVCGWGMDYGYSPSLMLYDQTFRKLLPLSLGGSAASSHERFAVGAEWGARAFQWQTRWLDNKTLLFGLTYRLYNADTHETGGLQQRLILYRMPDAVPHVLSTQYGADYLESLSDQHILFSPVPNDSYSLAEVDTTPLDVVPIEALIHQDKDDLQALIKSRVETIPPLCDPFVSPDGRWLAVNVPEPEAQSCYLHMRTLVLVALDYAGAQTGPIVSDKEGYQVSLGWTTFAP